MFPSKLKIECPRLHSVLLSQHNSDHTLGDRAVRCIWRMTGEGFVVIVDLEKDGVTIGFERAKVVLLMWIVGVAEIVKYGDRFDDARDHFAAEGGDTTSYHCCTFTEVLPQLIV